MIPSLLLVATLLAMGSCTDSGYRKARKECYLSLPLPSVTVCHVQNENLISNAPISIVVDAINIDDCKNAEIELRVVNKNSENTSRPLHLHSLLASWKPKQPYPIKKDENLDKYGFTDVSMSRNKTHVDVNFFNFTGSTLEPDEVFEVAQRCDYSRINDETNHRCILQRDKLISPTPAITSQPRTNELVSPTPTITSQPRTKNKTSPTHSPTLQQDELISPTPAITSQPRTKNNTSPTHSPTLQQDGRKNSVAYIIGGIIGGIFCIVLIVVVGIVLYKKYSSWDCNRNRKQQNVTYSSGNQVAKLIN